VAILSDPDLIAALRERAGERPESISKAEMMERLDGRRARPRDR